MLKETYLAVKKKMEKLLPDAHFEVVTRTAKHVLSPSWKLLRRAKAEKWDFGKYKIAFVDEMISNPKALQKMHELVSLAREKDVYLVCYEKDASKCHRTILIELMGEIE